MFHEDKERYSYYEAMCESMPLNYSVDPSMFAPCKSVLATNRMQQNNRSKQELSDDKSGVINDENAEESDEDYEDDAHEFSDSEDN